MAIKYITVSRDILQDQNLSSNEKFVLAEIEQLTTLEFGCIASNQHFADLIGITRANASRTITNLGKKGYIVCSIKMGTRNRERSIKMIKTYPQNDNTVVSKRQETKGNIQVNIQSNIQTVPAEAISKINMEAYKMWLEYKGNSYKKASMTMVINKLTRHSKDIQMKMVEDSIANGWKGLFEPKQKSVSTKSNSALDKVFGNKQNTIDVELIG